MLMAWCVENNNWKKAYTIVVVKNKIMVQGEEIDNGITQHADDTCV